MFYLYVNKYVALNSRFIFFTIQTANVAYFQRKIELSGFYAYPDVWPSQLIRISGVLLCFKGNVNITRPSAPRSFKCYFFL